MSCASLFLQSQFAARRMLSSLTLSTFPVLYFYTFLYYTDSGSTFFTLFMYLMALYGCHKTAALLGICAILFRQTNIIWVAFCAGTVVAQKLDESWRTELSKKRDEKSLSQVPLTISGLMRVIRFLLDFVRTAHNIKYVVLSTWPYMVLAAGFLFFIVLNNGIVVGDRSSHEACLNFPQIFYFLSFTLIFSLPTSLSYQRVVKFFQSLRKQPLTYLILMIIFLVLIWKFTFVHKYLLADNRHYPFYVWKRIFQRHDLVRFLLIPGYVFAMWNFLDTLKHKSLFWYLAFCVCLVLATIPQKLLEFRYFILPYLLYRIHVPLPSLLRLMLEFGLYTVVNAAALYIFLYKTFKWPDSNDAQRFMW